MHVFFCVLVANWWHRPINSSVNSIYENILMRPHSMCEIWFFNTCLKYFWILIMSCCAAPRRHQPSMEKHQLNHNHYAKLQKQYTETVARVIVWMMAPTSVIHLTVQAYTEWVRLQRDGEKSKKKTYIGKSKNRNSFSARISIRIIVKLSIYRWKFQFSPINHSDRSVFGQFANFPCCVKPKNIMHFHNNSSPSVALSVPTCTLCIV